MSDISKILLRHRSGDNHATLAGMYLRGKDLSNQDLSGINMTEANLIRANLHCAKLVGCVLNEAWLYHADLSGADLSGAGLRDARMRGADLRGATLPSPTMMLMADWGNMSDALTTDLMNYDASCHPDPEDFERWVKRGKCPYAGCRVERAAEFTEDPALWDPEKPLRRPYDLMMDVLREKCKID